jgi:hypothetical protein
MLIIELGLAYIYIEESYLTNYNNALVIDDNYLENNLVKSKHNPKV